MEEEVVARYVYAQQAADSATLRTSISGVVHWTKYDAESNTFVVVRMVRKEKRQ